MKRIFILMLIVFAGMFGVKATTTTLTMTSDDYQIIVDAVSASWSGYVNSYGTGDSYYGTNAYYTNFDIEADGSWAQDVFSSWEEVVQEAISVQLLPAKYTDATTEDTITVEFTTYDGSSSGTGSYSFICSKASPDPEFEIISKTTSFTMASEDYQIIVDSVAASWSGYVNSYGTGDSYYGTNAYYSNFDIEADGSWEQDVFDSWEEVIREAISVQLLPALYPDAYYSQIYNVTFTTYDGSNSSTETFTFVCTSSTPDPLFELYSDDALSDGFEDGLGNWTVYSVTGDDQVWETSEGDGVDESIAAYMNGYSDGNNENEDWLISSAIDILSLSNPSLSFYSEYKYSGDDITVKYSTDYSGSGDPSAATWTDFEDITLPESSYTWTYSGNISLSSISETTIYIAFVYTSTTESGKAWYIDDVTVGEYEPSSEAEITAFELDEQVSDAVIDADNYTVAITVAGSTDVTALSPEITISSGATISPESGANQDFTNPVTYTVTAEDESTQDWTVTVTVMDETITSIYDIQYIEGDDLSGSDGNSPKIGETVITTGVVTASSGSTLFIQTGTGAWNGIYVYNTTDVETNIGDSVLVTGEVTEYYYLTEIVPTSIEVVSTGNTVPEATEVTGALDESLEGVLVTINSVSVSEDTESGDSKAAFIATLNGEEIKIYNNLYSDFTPQSGTNYSITGVVSYTYSYYRISPRSADDIVEEDAFFYEDFEDGLDDWTVYSVTGDDQAWETSEGDGVDESIAAYMNCYSDGYIENEDWLISPVIDISSLSNPSLSFYSACYYSGDDLTVKYSTDYAGSGNPSSATWTNFSDVALSEGDWTWTFSGNISLSDISGTTLYIAFVYTSSTESGKSWTVDNVSVGEYTASSAKKITGFTLSEQVSDAVIDADNYTVAITVSPATDVTALNPEISLSTGATVSPESGTSQDFTNSVEYTVTAEDESTQVWTVTVTIMDETITSIYDIQYAEGDTLSGDDGNSPLIDSTVIVKGIVTAFASPSTSYNLFYIQDETTAWNGIYVYDNTTGTSLSTGDSVKVIGVVAEYYNLTEIDATSVEVTSTRNTVPDPIEVTGTLDESLEGLLVTVSGVTLSEDSDTEDDKAAFIATLNGEEIKVYDQVYSDIEYTADVEYDLTGVVIYTYSYYRICPRDALDIEESSTSAINSLSESEINVYPNPCSDVLYIEGLDNVEAKIINITGQVVKTVNISGNSINVSGLNTGFYTLLSGNNAIHFIKK